MEASVSMLLSHTGYTILTQVTCIPLLLLTLYKCAFGVTIVTLWLHCTINNLCTLHDKLHMYGFATHTKLLPFQRPGWSKPLCLDCFDSFTLNLSLDNFFKLLHNCVTIICKPVNKCFVTFNNSNK